MCGIAGIINLSGKLNPAALASLAGLMADAVAHRGPDDKGVWVDPSGFCALAQQRLSIIDLSAAGHQPMVHDATGCAITFNGEIYNYQSLRHDALASGEVFTGYSDTEVLLKGLVCNGSEIVNSLDGMFAFGFFDPRDKSLVLSRDIFGEKPLYYAQTSDWFAFASELEALRILPGFDDSIDQHRIATYLALQYLPSPMTIFRGACKLPPGHTLYLSSDGDVKIERHFTFTASSLRTGSRSMNDLADELEEILVSTVKTRLMADVPLGAFLSSGVDSSVIAAIVTQKLRLPLNSFSIGFEGSDDSEHLQARQMAKHLGTNHMDEVLPLDALGMGKHIASVLDEPNGDTSCLPTWVLSRLARRHVTVALSGDGGDEMFGGYGRYFRTMQDADEALAVLNNSWSGGRAYYSNRLLVYPDSALEKFMGAVPEDTQSLLRDLRYPLDRKDKPLLQLLRETDIENYMPGAVLAKVDRMSMQHALEVRAPFLGRDVAQFAMRMASDDLANATEGKLVLKKVAERYIPREWLDRPKQGFGLPVQGWGGEALAAAVEPLLMSDDCCLASWISKEHLRRYVEYHRHTPIAYQLWAVYILELWLRNHGHSVQ